jgi:pyruvate dehydrogenase E2 component (dihydrolipoamide acetyltransferase)
MSTPVVMPQMGESIAEGTIVRWIKKVGDSVDRDEPLFEISTDKVDAEIPSPAAGTLLEISVKEGETVPVNSVVATIGAAGEKSAGPSAAAVVSTPAATVPPSGRAAEPSPQANGTPASAPAFARPEPPASFGETSSHAAFSPAPTVAVDRASESEPSPKRPGGREAGQKSSPLVRRIAKEHGVDIGHISGSGIGGRVTKHDILDFIEKGAPAPQASASARVDVGASYGETSPKRPDGREGGTQTADRIDVQPMSIMRKKIAEHMVLSKRTSAHVYSVFEVDYTRVEQIRKARKADFERDGVKLTFTSFIAKVAVDCLRKHPVINASIDGDNVLYKRDINLGIAVALENGLIVPVVKHAHEKNILGLSRAIADVADRARAKRLNPDEVHGGTFTITNPGNFGAQFGLPIINQPQVAILGVGTIEKRAVVIDDMIGIRLRGYLTLGYDHRLVDGAVADQFMADVKKGIETFDPAQV